MKVSLTLDSGCVLPRKPGFVEIGIYRGGDPAAGFSAFVDGNEKSLLYRAFEQFREGCLIELRCKGRDGNLVEREVTESSGFRAAVIRLAELHGQEVQVDRGRFDFVLRMNSCHVRPSILKKRVFIETERQASGEMKQTGKWREFPAVSHNIVVHFDLDDGGTWEMVSGGDVLLSSTDLEVVDALDIVMATDDDAGKRGYLDCFQKKKRFYWFPDGCNEGPSGPYPPCRAD